MPSSPPPPACGSPRARKRANGSRSFSSWTSGKIDVVQVDLTRCGGFTEAIKIAALAADRGLPIVNHGFTTYLNVAAALHFLASIPNTLGLLEFVVEEGTTLRQSITETIRARDGMVAVPDAPGLGIELIPAGNREVPRGLTVPAELTKTSSDPTLRST